MAFLGKRGRNKRLLPTFLAFFPLFITIVLVFAAVAAPALPENTVIGITDGDTVKIMGADAQPFKVRLKGIDAPERGQPYARKSKKALSDLIYKKQVKIRGNKKDRYGRTLARLYVDDLDVSAEMVRQGAAWVYRKYTKDPILYAAEDEAKAHKRGLWTLPDPLPPWEYRRNGNAGRKNH